MKMISTGQILPKILKICAARDMVFFYDAIRKVEVVSNKIAPTQYVTLT
jgi:hypothetical protein